MASHACRALNRKRVSVSRGTGHPQQGIVRGSRASRLALVWPLTREAASLSRYHDVEQRLQRHVAVLGRREG
jgi:hypothetical protein